MIPAGFRSAGPVAFDLRHPPCSICGWFSVQSAAVPGEFRFHGPSRSRLVAPVNVNQYGDTGSELASVAGARRCMPPGRSAIPAPGRHRSPHPLPAEDSPNDVAWSRAGSERDGGGLEAGIVAARRQRPAGSRLPLRPSGKSYEQSNAARTFGLSEQPSPVSTHPSIGEVLEHNARAGQPQPGSHRDHRTRSI
jgi:hypothetical protein